MVRAANSIAVDLTTQHVILSLTLLVRGAPNFLFTLSAFAVDDFVTICARSFYIVLTWPTSSVVDC